MPSRPPAPPPGPRGPGERIAKLLARAGVASRREVERLIEAGRVKLDGAAVTTPATLLTSLAGVTVDDAAVAAPAPARLFAYHKPAGLLVAERDPAGRATIYDRLPAALPRVVPVGRLDLATEGLLLLTNDGGLKRELELPATGVERAYRARAFGPVSQASLEELIDGVTVEGVRYGPIDANLERRTGANTWLELTLTEGKNREVRRVLEHLGLEVSRLIRTRYGPVVLGDLPPGAVAEVRAADLGAFRRSLARGRGGDRQLRAALAPVPELAPAPAAPVTPASAPRRAGRPARPGQPARAGDEPGGAGPARRSTGDQPARAREGQPTPTRPGKAAGQRPVRDRPDVAAGERARSPRAAHPAAPGRGGKSATALRRDGDATRPTGGPSTRQPPRATSTERPPRGAPAGGPRGAGPRPPRGGGRPAGPRRGG